MLICNTARAGSFTRYGVGTFSNTDYGKTNVKFISLGYQEPIFGAIYKQLEAGLWTDKSGHGRTGSGFGSAALGQMFLLEILRYVLHAALLL